MSFDACGSVLVAEIDACRLTEIDAYGLMLMVEIGDCGGGVIWPWEIDCVCVWKAPEREALDSLIWELRG